MIRRSIMWRNNYAWGQRLQRIVIRATLPNAALAAIAQHLCHRD